MLRFKAFTKNLYEARRNAYLPIQQRLGALKTLEEYKDDDKIYISYTQKRKIGVNPKTQFTDTPAAVYTYPLKQVWKDIEQGGLANVKFAATSAKYIYVLRQKSRNVLDVSAYNKKMLMADLAKIRKSLPKNVIEQVESKINNTNAGDRYFVYLKYYIIIAGSILKKRNGAGYLTKVLMDLGYDGFTDKKGLGYIHPAEPIQAFFMEKSSYEVVDVLEIKNVDKKDLDRRDIAELLTKNASRMSDDEIYDLVKDDPELLRYSGPPRVELLKRIISNAPGRKEYWASAQIKPSTDYDDTGFSSSKDYEPAEGPYASIQSLFIYKKLPLDFLVWGLKKDEYTHSFSKWIKSRNQKIPKKVLDGLIKDISPMYMHNIVDLYDKIDSDTAKKIYDVDNSLKNVIPLMSEPEAEKFISSLSHYEIPEWTYMEVVARDMYKRLMKMENPSEDEIIRLAGYINKAAPLHKRNPSKNKIPYDLIDGLKERFQDFDFTILGGWDFWKK